MNLKPVEGLKEIYFQRRRPIYIIGAGGGYWQRDPLPEGKSRANAVVGFEEPVLCADATQVCVHCVSHCLHCVHCVSDSTQRLGSCSSRVQGGVIVQLSYNSFGTSFAFPPSIISDIALGARSQLTS